MKLFTSLLLITFAASLSGCARKIVAEGTHPPVLIPGPNTTARLDSVSLTDDSLQGKIAIQGSDSSRSDTGTVQVWVRIRNRTDYHMQVEARTQFYDADETPLAKPSAWQRLQLSPNTISTYRENSLGPDAAFYYVEIREGR